jgi:hypothetical protein
MVAAAEKETQTILASAYVDPIVELRRKLEAIRKWIYIYIEGHVSVLYCTISRRTEGVGFQRRRQSG